MWLYSLSLAAATTAAQTPLVLPLLTFVFDLALLLLFTSQVGKISIAMLIFVVVVAAENKTVLDLGVQHLSISFSSGNHWPKLGLSLVEAYSTKHRAMLRPLDAQHDILKPSIT